MCGFQDNKDEAFDNNDQLLMVRGRVLGSAMKSEILYLMQKGGTKGRKGGIAVFAHVTGHIFG